MRRYSFLGSLQILGAALLWSTAGACVKLLSFGSLSIASLRGLICALVLLGLRAGRRRGRAKVRFTRQNIAAGTAMFLTSTLFMMSNKLTTAANAIVLQYIAPILVLVYTIVAEKKRPTALEVLLTGAVFAGCVLAFSDKLTSEGTLGNILALVSGFTFAAMIVINGKEGTVPEDGQIIGCGMSFVCFLPALFFDSGLTLTVRNVGAMLFLGLFQYSLANILFARGVKKTEPTAASILLTMEPIMSPVWVFFALGEAPGVRALLGLGLVVAAVAIHSLSHRRKTGNALEEGC